MMCQTALDIHLGLEVFLVCLVAFVVASHVFSGKVFEVPRIVLAKARAPR